MTADTLTPFLVTLADGGRLSEADAEAAFDTIMSGEADPAQIAAFAMALRLRGETVAELTGGARALRRRALAVTPMPGAIDTCGTGGDGKGTFNISTAAAIVAAGCGVKVAKHGNRAATSKSGSSDVLAALGVNIALPPERIRAIIEDAGIGFMMAPLHHAAMKHVAPVRGALAPVRTVFNLLGPLANPAGARRQLLGVFARSWVRPMAEVLGALGAERAWVAHGADGLDELTTTGPSFVAELKDGVVREFQVAPEEAGLSLAAPEDLAGGAPDENAAALRALLDGAPGAYRDIVLLNTAAALIVADRAATLAEGAGLAAEAIDTGKARAALDRMVVLSHGNAPGAAR